MVTLAQLTAGCAAGKHEGCLGYWGITERMATLVGEAAGSGPCSCECHRAWGEE